MGRKMNNPYELAKNILQSVSDESQPIPANEGFRSIDLYGSSVHGKNENEDTGTFQNAGVRDCSCKCND